MLLLSLSEMLLNYSQKLLNKKQIIYDFKILSGTKTFSVITLQNAGTACWRILEKHKLKTHLISLAFMLCLIITNI